MSVALTKTQAIRDALKDGPLTLEQICGMCETSLNGMVSPKHIGDLLSNLKSRGQIHVKGKKREGQTYTLVANPPAPTLSKTKRAGKKRKIHKPAAAPIALKQIVRKHVDLPHAIVHHVGTAFAALETVLDTDDADPMVLAALRSLREAIELAQG